MEGIKHWLKTKFRGRLLRKALLLESKGRIDEAIRIYDRIGVAGRKDDPASLAVDIECLVQKALLLSLMGEHLLSTDTARQLIKLLTGVRDAFCRNRLAWAQLFLADELTRSGRFLEGMNEYDELIARFGFDDDAGIEEYVADGLVRKGQDLAEHGNNDDIAIRCFNDVLKRYGSTSDPDIEKHVAEARYCKAATLVKLGDRSSALSDYREIVETYGTHEMPSLRNVACRALFDWAVAGAEERQEGENIEAYESVINQFADSSDPEMRSVVGQAWGSIGTIHLSSDRLDSAIDAFSSMAAHLDGLEAEIDQENRLWALCLKGESLALAGRLDRAMQIFDEVVRAYDAAKRPVGHHLMAATLLARGAIHGSLGRIHDELSTYERIRLLSADQQGARHVLAYAIVNSIVALRRLNRIEEAERLDGELLRQFETVSDPEIQLALDLAARNRCCDSLDDLERFEVETLTGDATPAHR
jgi:tetratricopeptide (TPR) repeat protein